jgi:uncharacterized protein
MMSAAITPASCTRRIITVNNRRTHLARWFVAGLLAVACATLVAAQQGPPPGGQGQRGPGGPAKPTRKQVLFWGEMTGGGAYHDSVNAAMVTIYKLGKDTGLFDVTLTTNSQFITKQKLTVSADGRDWPVGRNLDYFDAIFFYGMRELPLTQQQMTELVSFVKDDGKGFVAAHTADTAFQRFPEFGELMGATYDGHPWNRVKAQVVVTDPAFPAMKGFAPTFSFEDEMYQVKDFSWDKSRVLLNLDTSTLDMKNQNVHRGENDFPQAWVRMHGKGRVFVAAFGHDSAVWEKPEIQTMWLEALKWALGLTQADVTPKPKPGK